MKNGIITIGLGLALCAATQCLAQDGQSINNRYGPPTYTGGTVNSPNQNEAAYRPLFRMIQSTRIAAVFPNPAQAGVNIELQTEARQSVRVDVYNLNGTLMQTYAFSGGGTRYGLDVSNLPNGLYSLQVQEKGKSLQSYKLMKAE